LKKRHKENDKMATRVLLKNVRLSYANLFTPRPVSKEQDAPLKYSTGILMPKDHPQLKELKAAIFEAGEKKFGAKAKAVISKKNPLRDGDAVDEEGERTDDSPDTIGMITFNCSSKADRAPQVVDRNRQPILNEQDIYSGCWVNISVAAFGYDVDVNKGVGLGLNNVQLVKIGERLGGVPNADEEFEDLGDDDDDADFTI
jgi:hypothetical protein